MGEGKVCVRVRGGVRVGVRDCVPLLLGSASGVLVLFVGFWVGSSSDVHCHFQNAVYCHSLWDPLPSPPFPPLLSWQEIHQTKGFTKVWWTLKCSLFPLTTFLLLVFLCKTRGRQRVLMESALAYMGGAVAFMGGEQWPHSPASALVGVCVNDRLLVRGMIFSSVSSPQPSCYTVCLVFLHSSPPTFSSHHHSLLPILSPSSPHSLLPPFSLVLLSVPVEIVSLYLDCPWLIVFNDVRAGLVFLSMAMYWIVFIGEHSEVSLEHHTCGHTHARTRTHTHTHTHTHMHARTHTHTLMVVPLCPHRSPRQRELLDVIGRS